MPCPLLAALGLFRATLLLLLLRLLEHGEIALHALAFFGTPALHHLGPQQMLNVLGGDRRSGVQMHHEVQESTLLNARRLGICVLHNVVQGDALDIRTDDFAIRPARAPPGT